MIRAASNGVLRLDTESNGHAQKITSEILPDEYDAVVSISGDGTLHEIVNGFAQHKEPMRALRLPIAPIPAGSGNGTCLNLLGIQDEGTRGAGTRGLCTRGLRASYRASTGDGGPWAMEVTSGRRERERVTWVKGNADLNKLKPSQVTIWQWSGKWCKFTHRRGQLHTYVMDFANILRGLRESKVIRPRGMMMTTVKRVRSSLTEEAIYIPMLWTSQISFKGCKRVRPFNREGEVAFCCRVRILCEEKLEWVLIQMVKLVSLVSKVTLGGLNGDTKMAIGAGEERVDPRIHNGRTMSCVTVGAREIFWTFLKGEGDAELLSRICKITASLSMKSAVARCEKNYNSQVLNLNALQALAAANAWKRKPASRSTPALVRPVRVGASTRLSPRVITVDSPIIPTQNQFQIMLFGLARKLLRVLLKAVWKGLKGAIGSLVARTTTGWRIRLDVKVHLNLANGLGNVVDWSIGPIRLELSRGIEAIPSVEGANQV
ncbi:hypothetical protein EDB83DRAFT_2319840 [Lactarius deliciosus]|nr:hypothetical protein EDB83DRAFT_2319840 [Lactarius deliciosus]